MCERRSYPLSLVGRNMPKSAADLGTDGSTDPLSVVCGERDKKREIKTAPHLIYRYIKIQLVLEVALLF